MNVQTHDLRLENAYLRRRLWDSMTEQQRLLARAETITHYGCERSCNPFDDAHNEVIAHLFFLLCQRNQAQG